MQSVLNSEKLIPDGAPQCSLELLHSAQVPMCFTNDTASFSHYYSAPLAVPPFAMAAAVNRNGQHQSNNSHGSIQQGWQHFLEVDNQSAQSYCVIMQKVEP